MADAPSAQSLAEQAHSEVQQQIDTETSPYESDITQAQGGMASGLAGIGSMFGNLLPYAQNAAKFVGDYYDASIAREGDIYEQAQGRLSMIRAQRAAEAQQFAQQTGGPVNVEAFLAPLNTSMVELPNAQQNTLFHSNMLAQGGVQEAQAWSGRVFPMLQVEQEAQLRSEFQAKIDSYQKEITRIRASASGREQTRLEQLQQQEREYKLEQARLALDRLKADRDWRVAQQQLRQSETTLRNQRAELMGYVEGRYRGRDGKIHTWRKPTWAAKQFGTTSAQEQAKIDEAHAARVAGNELTEEQITNNKVNADRAYELNKLKMDVDERSTAGKLIASAMTPGNQTIKYSDWSIVPNAANLPASERAKLVPKMLNGKKVWYKVTPVTKVISSPTINDPTQLITFLLSNGVHRDVALDAVRARFQLSKKWVPGMRYDPATRISMDKINGMSFAEARKAAIDEGWLGTKNRDATAYTIKTWLYNHYGYKITDKQHPPTDVGTRPGTYKNFLKNNPNAKWDPVHKYWHVGNVVVLRGHPPGKDKNPT